MLDIGTGGSQQKLAVNFSCGSMRQLKRDVYHYAMPHGGHLNKNQRIRCIAFEYLKT